ncbi:MAG: WYL domain-containing protein [Methylococcaceae bacterium]
MTRFGIQSAAATRDLSFYKELVPDNIEYDSKAKSYVLGHEFRSVFDFRADQVLSWITQGFGDGEPVSCKASIICETSLRLIQAELDTLACITRAIHQQHPLKIEYHSITSGKTQREIVPFALIDNGLRWYVRAFDRKAQDFRDFVITRIKQQVTMKDAQILAHERSDQDIQWTRIVELELVPHPDQPHPEITEIDYGMKNGILKKKLRAATAGYILRKWSVDCSPDHCLQDHEYRLWLRNHLALNGAKNAVLAPGYRSPDQSLLLTDLD